MPCAGRSRHVKYGLTTKKSGINVTNDTMTKNGGVSFSALADLRATGELG
jgi:hypothetical protein